MLSQEELIKLFENAKNKDEAGAALIQSLARENMKDFLEFFREDYASIIDWSKGFEILDDELKNYVSQRDLKKKDAFFIVVQAFRKSGAPMRFIINTVVNLKKGLIKVGIADVPDQDDLDFEDEPELDEEEIMSIFAKAIQAGLKKGGIKPLDDSPNCSRCGRSDLPLTITIEATSLKAEKICAVCMSTGGARNEKQKPKSVSELDSEIAEYEDLAKMYEKMIVERPEPDKLDSVLSKYAQTPLSNYRSIQAILADLKAKRMQAFTSMEEAIRLEYELKKALDVEDYEKSAELRDKLNKLKTGKGKTK